jgi:hypothetical protein
LVMEPEGKGTLERLKHRYDNNNKMVLKCIGWRACARLICHKLGTCGWLLCMW